MKKNIEYKTWVNIFFAAIKQKKQADRHAVVSACLSACCYEIAAQLTFVSRNSRSRRQSMAYSDEVHVGSASIIF